ncbi:skeletal aspartic acid-rich protein 2 [Nematostella vectensis]|uniref:skeletal aspartic acid-rich protein 2 n=1 Tax=Nematostella vectensis TaxID=45351 RepID=UPI0020770D1D|nr:skeletal aspartic acid-rich protein 2 [Nematostella vectensis]
MAQVMLVAAFMLSSVSADLMLLSNGVGLKIQSTSGKMILYSEAKFPLQSPAATITFEALKEVDGDGNEVGKDDGNQKHAFDNFAAQDFETSNTVDVVYQGIKAVAFKFTTKITSVDATFTIQVRIFKESGSYVWGDEEIEVKQGTMKFNILVNGWKFCGDSGASCRRNETGSHLDSKFCVQAREKGEKMSQSSGEKGPKGKDKAGRYSFGNVFVDIPIGVLKDGVDANMPSGFPKLSTNESTTCFTVRFPKFNETALFDPAVTKNVDYVPLPQPTQGVSPKTSSRSGASSIKWSVAVVLINLVAAW